MNLRAPFLAVASSGPGFTGLDWAVIAVYFALLLGITWRAILKNRDTTDDYFLASRHLGWLIVGASIFASNIGSDHLAGDPEE
ncbi:MAG: hypothetical protein M1608_05125 [Candidatus Omnitrophica bacterium]|nr:hypothetical protein [Candidatus Omnitrophota bacterium]